jgi:hypothetical protein
MYGLIAKYFIEYDAVAMNLSLLTTSVWGAVCDFVVFNDMLNPFTLFGFFFIVGGVTLYHTRAQQHDDLVAQEDATTGAEVGMGDDDDNDNDDASPNTANEIMDDEETATPLANRMSGGIVR